MSVTEQVMSCAAPSPLSPVLPVPFLTVSQGEIACHCDLGLGRCISTLSILILVLFRATMKEKVGSAVIVVFKLSDLYGPA